MNSTFDLQQQPHSLWVHRWSLQTLASLVMGLVLACGGGGGGGGTSTPPAPTITSFTATPTTLTIGDTTTPITLTGVFADGTGAVDPLVGPVTSGTLVSVTPVATTTYTLTVTNSAGTTATKTATVTFVAAPTVPTIAALTSVTALSSNNVASITAQAGSTYAWTITNGTITAGADTTSITFTAGATGTIHLACTVTNAAGTASAPGVADLTIVAAGNSLLTVTITKLGGLTDADVSFTGHANLTATTVIDCTSLADGLHTITANDVVQNTVIHYPWLRTQTVTVTSGVPSVNAVTVLYPAPTMRINIPNASGPPATIPMDFVLVPPGSFSMGAAPNTFDSNALDATPAHPVTILHAFYVAKTPCTQAQYMAVTGTNPSFFSIVGTGAITDDFTRPVERVSWNRIRGTGEYLDQLNAMGLGTFRLPSEAEYEYVVRAGTTTNYFFGDAVTNLPSFAWFNQASTMPVGLLASNPWGLNDITGNVWEWCEDDSHGSRYPIGDPKPPTTDSTGYSGAPSDGTAWVDSGTRRIVRGGGWSGNDDLSPRSAFRFDMLPAANDQSTGFRVVMSIP